MWNWLKNSCLGQTVHFHMSVSLIHPFRTGSSEFLFFARKNNFIKTKKWHSKDFDITRIGYFISGGAPQLHIDDFEKYRTLHIYINCLYNSSSIVLTGNESLNTLLRTAVSLKLLQYVDYYAKYPYISHKIGENPD